MGRRFLAITIIAALAALLRPADSFAFRVEESQSNFYVTNGVGVLEIGDVLYTISEIPNPRTASEFESLPTANSHPEFNTLTLGDPVTKEEALSVIEQYYRHTAIDFSSLVIRDFRMGSQLFVFWCSEPNIFGCLKRQGRAGTWVDFEINGANKLGGLTGFAWEIRLIRKVSKKAGETQQAAPRVQTNPF